MRATIEAFVNRECALLDTWELDAWRDLFHEDGVYWLPMDEASDPRFTSSIIYDDLQGLSIRVEQLMRQNRISQKPRSETIHFVTNLAVEETAGGVVATYNQQVEELRSGDWLQQGLGEFRRYPGRCRLTLVRDGDGWKIMEKKLILLGRKQPIEGLSFLL
ncbi:MAG: 3-phenylpropionate/cinnamic acid dioxygenase subunit beta [Caulobacteraceae bacterium]|nr:3-phenylpropionate/cinnamic acid dioxygenase subunit beta [Caulobacteraceae bacterium]